MCMTVPACVTLKCKIMKIKKIYKIEFKKLQKKNEKKLETSTGSTKVIISLTKCDKICMRGIDSVISQK